MPHGLVPGEVTTATLIQLDYKLEMKCRGCRHQTVVDPYDLRRMFPQAVRLDRASAKLRCTRCGRNHPRMWIHVMAWMRKRPPNR